jgi:hypothetical protein
VLCGLGFRRFLLARQVAIPLTTERS